VAGEAGNRPLQGSEVDNGVVNGRGGRHPRRMLSLAHEARGGVGNDGGPAQLLHMIVSRSLHWFGYRICRY